MQSLNIERFKLIFLRNFSGNFNLLKVYINRFLRYFPSVVFTVTFFMGGLPGMLSRGPLFETLTDKIGYCQKKSWENLIFVQNYFSGSCQHHQWYLSADLQMFSVAPFIVYFIWMLGRKSIVLIMMLIVGLQYNLYTVIQR